MRTNTREPRRLFAASIATVVVAALAGCGSDGGSTSYGTATFDVDGGWEQVTVTGATAGDELELVTGDDSVVAGGTVDSEGALILRRVEPGTYRVRTAGNDPAASDEITVKDRDETPADSFYDDQTLPAPGFGYVETRDGTTLSVNVSLPGDPEDGPYPTVVEYSGYDPSNPANTTFPLAFNTLGYAYVGVNMRGTGCSGGSYRFFELMQLLDAYDMIEAIAAEPWVLNNKVGMVGISYPGITQLFAASTRPPSLAAITPLSVLDDSYRGTLYPGGILNEGFAVNWTSERVENSRPYGQGWEQGMVDDGDTVCADNQKLRGQNPDLLAEIADNPYYIESIGDEINPSAIVGDIEVPVFIAGAWQDEQTGGRFPALLDKFDGSPHVYAYLVNGLHTESLISTGIYPRLVEFLELYVARRVPNLDRARIVAALLGPTVTGVKGADLGENRFDGMTYDEALAAYEAEPSVNVLFEEGAAAGVAAGAASPRWISSFDAWPIADAEDTALYLGADGTLSSTTPATPAETSYVADPEATPDTFYSGSLSDVWKAGVVWDWRRNRAGTAAEFTTDVFSEATVFIGSGSADLWIKSTKSDTDLEVTISEIRPDGKEIYVQSGWLRASQRALDEKASTPTRPVITQLRDDAAADLGTSAWTPVRVEIFPFAHAFRPGSRLRVTIDAPGGNRAQWVMRTIADGETVTIGHGDDTPSRIVLARVAGIDVPASYPACSLRGQPCRPAE